MSRLRICFEVQGLAADENGNPCSAGLQLDLGETEKAIDYDRLSKDINIPGILSLFGLDDTIQSEDVRVILPEEYDERYGN